MKPDLARTMAMTTRLTRAGRLHEATALIQQALNPQDVTPPPVDPAQPGDVVEGVFTRLPDATPKATPENGTASGNTRQKATPTVADPRPTALRSGLRETLRRIAAGRMPAAGSVPGGPVAVAPGAQFLSLHHRSEHGARDYRLYVPANVPVGPMPLVVMLHGCTQSPEDFARGTGMNALAEEFGCMIAYPAQPTGANAQKCWNWFRPQDQRRDQGEPALIAGLTRDILRERDADPARVFVAGLSAGGAAAAIMAHSYPDLFRAAGVHSGLAVGSARDVPSAFAAMRGGAPAEARPIAVPMIVFQGLADTTVHPQNASAVMGQALQGQTGLRSVVEPGVTQGGRSFRRTIYSRGDAAPVAELWEIDGAGHAWAGGDPSGSYTDPAGPDASRQMLRFFLGIGGQA